MSFCIRSISNGSRYVPTLITSVQGCNARRFSSRQLPKHVNRSSTSTFLNDFLGSNVPMTFSVESKDDYRVVNISSDPSNNVHTMSSSVPVNYVSDRYYVDHVSENSPEFLGEGYEVYSQEFNQVPYTSTMKEQLDFLDTSNSFKNQMSISNEQDSWIYSDSRTNFTNIGTLTKDKTKARFASVTKTATALKEKDTNSKSKLQKKQNDDLELVYETLSVDLPNFFVKSLDYKIYHQEMEFVNNIRGTTSKGLVNYVKQMALLRTIGHIKYAYIKFNILKITMHTQDNTVRVRWRISGISGMKVMFSFWKFKCWKIKESLKEQETWYDGFSTFYVGDDGKVYKHVADKMMPDESQDEVKTKPLPSKLASQLTFSSLE